MRLGSSWLRAALLSFPECDLEAKELLVQVLRRNAPPGLYFRLRDEVWLEMAHPEGYDPHWILKKAVNTRLAYREDGSVKIEKALAAGIPLRGILEDFRLDEEFGYIYPCNKPSTVWTFIEEAS